MGDFELIGENGLPSLASAKTIDLEISIDAEKSINYVNWQAEKNLKAAQGNNKQNVFSFLRKIEIENKGISDIFNATLEIKFLPDCISCDAISLTCLEKGKTTVVDASINLLIDPKFLYELNESINGSMNFVIKDKDGLILASKTQDIRILPIEESASEERIRMVLSSYVTPHDDAVLEIKKRAALIKGEKTGNPAFDGYQAEDANDVLQQIDAIWRALQSIGITYSNPPTSFEKTFQRVRLPRTVLNEKAATCLDFSLLFCSVLEAADLHPLLIIVEGHAFCGCWLVQKSFQEALIDNSTFLSNCISEGSHEIAIYDATGLAKGVEVSPMQASESAQGDLFNIPFSYALDLFGCRKDGLLPVPTPHLVDGKVLIDFKESLINTYTEERVGPIEKGLIDGGASSKGRFDVWEEKLLDLNMRNNLINMRLGGQAVQLMTTDVVELFNHFQKNPQIGLYPLETEPIHDSRFLAFANSRSQDGEKAKDLFSQNLLMARSANGQTEKNIINLARKSNSEIEESGCNPLYLTIGAIRWFDNEKAAEVGTSSLFSPILLIPASLPRRRFGSNFTVSLNLDGIQFNKTVFEYFKQSLDLDFSEFNNLFSDKSPVINLQKIYNTIRKKIEPKRNWIVMDDFVSLSMFSFAHFVMWTDMKNSREEFLKNPIVSSFVNGKKEWADNPFEIGVNDLDDKVKPDDLAIPLPADSSQIKAIESSLQGESFILDGPPGTGKSQTIANMITNFLFHGKKVLFVAEKKVALEVVKSRLDKLGLGQFCLQVHSAKANKKDVLAQIKDAWAIGSTQSPSEYSKKAEQIEGERHRLNSTLYQLHKPQGYFLSVYDAIIAFLQLEQYKNKTVVTKEYAKSLTASSFEEAKKALTELGQYGKVVGGYANNPLNLFQNRDYSLERRNLLFQVLESFLGRAKHFAASNENLFHTNNLGIPSNQTNSAMLQRILGELKEGKQLNYAFLGNDAYFTEGNQILAYLDLCFAYASAREDLAKTLKPEAIAIDEQSLLQTLRVAEQSHFIRRLVLINGVYRRLRPYEGFPKAIKKKDLRTLLLAIAALKAKKTAAAPRDLFLKMILPDEVDKTSQDILLEEEKTKNTLRVSGELRSLIPFPDSGISLAEQYFVSFKNHPEKTYSNETSSFINEYDTFASEIAKMKRDFDFDYLRGPDGDSFFSKEAVVLEKAISEKEKLSEWVEFLRHLDVAKKWGPQALLEQYQVGEIKEDELLPVFENALYYRIIVNGLDDGGLGSLTSLAVDQQIAVYRNDLDNFAALSVEETAAKITSSYPDNNIKFAASTAPYQLSHFCENGGRGLSLRGLFDNYGKLIQTLCPCFLMSPLSVSQYFHVDNHAFDVVIFDEASQIPTCEAIGAIARGQSVIIAGDNNQMPPTNFFSSGLFSNDDESSDNFVNDDLESLLGDAIAMKLPRIRLNCHYRSNHESLIAFSNNKFYENTLMTFPSPSNQVSRVRFHYLENGAYEMGKGTNKPEAIVIVQEILRRLRDPILQKKSIGIITFNEKQQSLIEDLLSKEFDSDSGLQQHPGDEEIFIKNLENVQGDERDVILFSICFGPCGKQHKMPLNFGPLSKEGGQRRLNVAVSRARDEMVVYSSCQPDEIRANEAKNEGAEYLRSFLLYAKNGVKTLTNALDSHLFLPPCSVADFLARDLRSRGYQVDLNVGSSSFRVDIGIKDPSNPDRYILGVICDSPSYVKSPTCRDRNVVEPAMLSRLKWSIVNVWSVEYFDHPDLVVKRIIDAIANPLTIPMVTQNDSPIVYPIKFQNVIKSTKTYSRERPYVVGIYPSASYDGRLDETVAKILSSESPISNSLLEKRIRQIYGIGRIGDLIEASLKQGLRNNRASGERYLNEVYWWSGDNDSKGYSIFRTGGDRGICDIPYQEVANGAMDILSVQGPMSEEDLIKTLVHLFGGTTVTDKASDHMKRCLKASQKNGFGKIVIENYFYKV